MRVSAMGLIPERVRMGFSAMAWVTERVGACLDLKLGGINIHG